MSTLARPTTRRSPMTTGLIGELNLEWRRICDTPLPHRWRALDALSDDTLGELIDRLSRMAGSQTDPILHALLTLHADGDALAGRTVLQTMLGKAARLARTAHARGIDDPNVAAVEAVWSAIHRYPLHRDSSVAGNIALDALAALLRQARPRAIPLPYLDQVAADGVDETEAFQSHLTHVLSWALDLQIITADDVRLLARVHLSAEPVTLREVAEDLGVTHAALRQRHSRLVRRLASAVSTRLHG